MWVQSLGRENPLEEDVATTPVFLPGKFHGWRSLADYSPWGHKESDMTERTHTHSCIGLFIKCLYMCFAKCKCSLTEFGNINFALLHSNNFKNNY